jgi:ferredoxin-NADP reductase
VMTLHLAADSWLGHLPGQHVDVRLTADDGYQAQRSYSISSAPARGALELTVEDITSGEVSPYLSEVLQTGDQLELRGPIGGHFTWTDQEGGPLLLVAGGSGVAPIMSMLRYRRDVASTVPVTVLLSFRTWIEIIYKDELSRLASDPGVNIMYTLTRSHPDQWLGFDRRIDAPMLNEVFGAPVAGALVYVCGPTGLVEATANALVALGYEPERIKTERFGPTGA